MQLQPFSLKELKSYFFSAPGRFEYRSVDSMVNPYLMAAALLKAFDDGIERNLDPGEPEQRSLYEVMDNGKQVKKLPMSLGEALDCLAADRVIQSAMPGDVYRLYKEYKIDEWERFMATVSDWDMVNLSRLLALNRSQETEARRCAALNVFIAKDRSYLNRFVAAVKSIHLVSY